MRFELDSHRRTVGVTTVRERRVLSLGAGVQSSALYLMAVHGEFGEERPELAIFADTQWEPRAVYDWLSILDAAGGSTIPIQRVTAGNIRADALSGKRFAAMPLFVGNKEGKTGMMRRQCTNEYKIAPITKAIRSALGVAPRQRVPKGLRCELWMGISTDEATRMKDNRLPWLVNRYPLIERDMSRRHCEAWLHDHGYPTPAKSACIGCPYTNDGRWREMKATRPDEFADAVAFDNAMRSGVRFNALAGKAHLHRSLLPLADVDLTTAEERGQVNMFENECEGHCGV